MKSFSQNKTRNWKGFVQTRIHNLLNSSTQYEKLLEKYESIHDYVEHKEVKGQ